MRARIKATGDTYEITWQKDNVLRLEDGNIYPVGELDLLVDEPDWQHYRIQAAIAAMQGMVISDAYCSEKPVGPSYQIKRRKWAPARIAQEAVAYADFLIAELKGGKDDNNH